MLKKRVMAVITGVAFMMSQAAVLVMVNAAELSTSPWSFYTVSANDWNDVSSWRKVSAKKDNSNTYTFYNEGRQSTAPIIRMYNDRMQIVPNSDANAKGTEGNVNATDSSSDIQTGRGSLIVAFTVPYSGDWNIDANCRSREGASNDSVYGTMELAVISNGESLSVDDSITDIPKGNTQNPPNVSMERELTLAKGEIVALKVKSTGDSYGRNFWFNYVISDANNSEIEYDVLDGSKYVSVNNQDVYNPAQNAIIDTADDAEWDLLYTYDVDNENYKTISNFVAPATSTAERGCWKFESDPTGASSSAFKSILFFSKGFPNGGFRMSINGANPNGNDEQKTRFNNIKYNPVIKWTAPSEGDYVISFTCRNIGADANITTSEKSNHRLASSKAGDTEVTILDSFTTAGSSSKAITDKQWIYSLSSGENIYLINDAGTDNYGDCWIANYKIENIATGESWDFSKYMSERLKNSPFSFFSSSTSTPYTMQFDRAKFTQDNTDIIASVSGNKSGNYVILKADGTMDMFANKANRNAIAFDVPKSGLWKVEVVAENKGEGSETTLSVKTHTDYASCNYRGVIADAAAVDSVTIAGAGEKKYISKIISLDENDRIWLINQPNDTETGSDINVKYVITKVDAFDVTYRVGSNVISSTDEIPAGGTIDTELVYVSDAVTEGTAVIAAYDGEGKMIAVNLNKATFSANSTAALDLSLTLPDDKSAKVVKVFLIKDVKTMVPITEAVELN